MKNLCLFAAILWFIGLVSCQNNSASKREAAKMEVSMDDSDIKTIEIDSTNVITFDIKKTKEIKDVWELIDNIEYIPLETNDNVLMGNIEKLMLYNGKYYLLDGSIAYSVFIFNEDGSHYKTINNVGRGPQEYVKLNNMTIDKYNDELILTDRSDYSLHFYDTDGNFKKKENCGVRFADIIRITKDDFLVYLGTYWNIHIPDIDNYYIIVGSPFGEIKQRGLFKDDFYRKLSISGKNHIHICEDNVLLSTPFTNKIYHAFPNGKLSLRYQFIFENGSPKLYRSIDNNDFDKFFSELAKRKVEYLLEHKILETDNYLLAVLDTGGESIRHFIYDKKTKESFITTKEYIPSMAISFMLPEFTDGHYFYSWTTPSYIQHIKNRHAEGKIQFPDDWKMPEILDKADESDNPILIKYKLKTSS